MTRKEILKHNVVMLSGYYESQGASYHFKECYMKVCTKCGVKKDESEFYKNQYHCKSCEKVKSTKYYENNKDKLKQKVKEYRENNKDTIKDKAKEYRENNKDKAKEYQNKYRENNREKAKEYSESYKQRRNEKRRLRYNNDSLYKIECSIRTNLKQAFKLYSKNGKTKSCKEYEIDFKAIFDKIGYKDDITMHLDHIIPLSVFDLDNPNHIRLAHLPCNLRWLNATENIQKSDNIDMQLIRCSLALTIIAQEIGLI